MNHVTTDFAEGLEWVLSERPLIAVLDHDLGGAGALNAVASIIERVPRLHVVLTAVRFSGAALTRAYESNVRACLLKSDTLDAIRAAFHAVLAGQIVFSQPLRERFRIRRNDESGGLEIHYPLNSLTRREVEVLTGIGRGLSTKQIAALLGVSPKTADHHRANVMAKLNIHDRVLLAHLAIGEGLVVVGSSGDPRGTNRRIQHSSKGPLDAPVQAARPRTTMGRSVSTG